MRSRNIGIPTYIIASNRLAGEYLVQILAKDRFARPILCLQLPQPRLRSTATVFVIEGSLVPIPLRECIRRLRSLFPKGRFVMVDRAQPDTEIMVLIKLGFHGFVEHEKAANSLGAAVRAVAAGRLWISDDLMQEYMKVAAESERLASDKPLLPTLREREVLELVRQRLSNREIAMLLSVSEHTVKYHLANILAKYRVSSRRELENTPRAGVARIWEQLSKPAAH
jgi:DNA-binding NarL/FixJ family response regulator